MIKLSIFFLLIASFSFSIAAQEKKKENEASGKPNLSGTWIIDKEKSYSKSSERKKVDYYKLIISHSGEEIKIARNYSFNNQRSSFTEILFTDKRGERNLDKTGMTDFPEIKSATFWKKQSIVRRFLYNKRDTGTPYVVSSEKYALSDDGKTLTITTEYELGSRSELTQSAIQQNGFTVPKTQLIFIKQQ
jgi:hypothetical protein